MAVDLARVDLWANAGKPARYSVARELTETVNTGGAGNRTGGPSTTAGGALGNNSGGSCGGFVGSGSNGNARTAVLVAEGGGRGHTGGTFGTFSLYGSRGGGPRGDNTGAGPLDVLD